MRHRNMCRIDRYYTKPLYLRRFQMSIPSYIVISFSPKTYDAQCWEEFAALLPYFQGDLEVPAVSKHIDHSACL